MRVPDLLAPAVCLHCMDPECLTGCPTGAIARLSHGQVDINRNTCIGCGDCAINCPYGAISLVSRNPPAPGAPAANSIADLVQIRKQPLPPPVEQTEGLVAVKCNLCRGTGLNPEGSATPAYGCEENCPTGALVRLAPRDQLPELRGIEGPAYRAPGAPPAGRNHHRKDPVAFGLRWAGRASVVLVAALGALAWNRFGLDRPILAGLDLRWITGIAGLAGIVITMLYPHRRRIFRRRAGPLRYWVLVHRYAGFAGAAAIFIHAGSARGGSLLTQGLMLSFDAVILTGIWGLLSYWLGPRHLARLEDGPMLFDDLLRRRAELRSDLAAFLAGSADAAALRSLVARFSSLRAVAGDMVAMVPLAEAIRAETARRPPGHAPAVEAAVALRRIEGLLLIHRMMLSWLPPHVVFTSLMLGMLVIHIFQVIYAAG